MLLIWETDHEVPDVLGTIATKPGESLTLLVTLAQDPGGYCRSSETWVPGIIACPCLVPGLTVFDLGGGGYVPFR